MAVPSRPAGEPSRPASPCRLDRPDLPSGVPAVKRSTRGASRTSSEPLAPRTGALMRPCLLG